MKRHFLLSAPLVLCAGILAISAPLRAQNTTSPTVAPKLEAIRAGELRLDGKITGLLGANRWSMEAISFSAPSGGSKEFEEPRSKSIVLAPGVVIHPIGETQRVAVSQIKVGSRIAVIGTNRPDGSLLAREVILLEGYGARRTVGTLGINPFSMALVAQSRAARDRGQMNAALEAAQKAVETARGMSDQSGEALSTQDLTLIYLETENYAKALESALRVESLGKTMGSELAMLLGLANKASAFRGLKRLEDALKALEEATPMAARVDADIYRRILSQRFFLLLALERKEDALNWLSRLTEAELSANLATEALGSRLLDALLRLPQAQGNARAIAASATKIIEAETEPKKKAVTQLLVGALLWRTGDRDAARREFAAAQAGFEATQSLKEAQRLAEAETILADGTDAAYLHLIYGLTRDEATENAEEETP